MKRAMMAAMMLVFGTAAQAQWTQTSGPVGGSIYSIATDGEVTIAVGTGPGMLVHDGTSWHLIDSIDAYNVFAVGRVFFASPLVGEMLRSDDGGATWTATGFNGMLTGITGEGNNLFTALGPEIYHSADTGRTWTVSGMLMQGHIDRVLLSGSRLVARTYDRTLFASADSGQTWSPTGGGSFPDTYLYSWAASGDTIVASFLDSGAYISRNGGATWSAINQGLPFVNGGYPSGTVEILRGSAWLASARGLYLLEPGGWRLVSSEPAQVLAVDQVTPGAGTIYAGSGAGIFRIDLPAMNLTMLNDTFRVQEIADLRRSAGAILAATPGGIYRTPDNGATWSRTSLYGTRAIAMTGAAGVALVDQQGGTIYRTADDGRTWTEGVEGLTEPAHSASALASAGSDLYVGFATGASVGGPEEWADGGIFRSTDGGAHWTAASNGLPVRNGVPVPVLKLAAWGDDVVALTSEGLYHSGDKGTNWSKRDVTLVGYAWNNSVEASMDTFYVATGNKVYRSVGGENWTAEDLVLEGTDTFLGLSLVNGVPVVVVSRPSSSLARFPVYMRGKEGWKRLEGLPEDGRFTSFIGAGGDVLAGSMTSSVWRAPLSVLGGGASGVERPDHAAVNLVSSPNPFRDRTLIRFSMRNAGTVHLSLADPLGREVAVLFSGDLAAGEHQFPLDGRGLAPGAYFYRIETGAAISVGKVVKSE